MGRPTEGWYVRLPKGRTVYLVRFEHAGRTVERSTGERDPGAAAKAAARIYARVVLGVVAPVRVDQQLEELFSVWLAGYGLTHAAGTAATAEGYARLFLERFGSLDRLTEGGYAGFVRTRLGEVTRSTLRKELSALRQFRAWLLAERGIRIPEVPGIPKLGQPGKRSKHARRRQHTALAPADVERILAEVPERAPRTGLPVRAFLRVCYETALRPWSTVARLEAPLHYRRGAPGLFITREIDKAGDERTVPLTAAARAALDAVVRVGLIFAGITAGAVRETLARARRAAGIREPVSIYDLRHSRLSALANAGGPLTGVSYIAGHRYLSTTSKYVRATENAAAAAILAEEASRGAPETPGLRRPPTELDNADPSRK